MGVGRGAAAGRARRPQRQPTAEFAEEATERLCLPPFSAAAMKAVIKVASGSTVNIDVELEMKVTDVKALIGAQTDTPAERQVRTPSTVRPA